MLAKQNSTNAGDTDAGYLGLSFSGSVGATTDRVYEPIFYYILPSSTTLDYVDMNTIDPAATVTEYTTDDGRTGVKIDYTGTGLYVIVNSISTSGMVRVYLNNNADALPGTYQYLAYVTSPLVKLQNSIAVTDTSLTDGDANAVKFSNYVVTGPGSWTITAISTSKAVSLAQGNTDVAAVQNGSQDIGKTDGETMDYYVTMMNTSSSGVTNATTLVNLPQTGDSLGSTFTFQLTGPVTTPTTYEDGTAIPAGTVTVLYSTATQTPTSDGTSGAQPSTTGYVTADQVTDWAAIKSVIIEYTNIPSNDSTGRIDLTGTAEDIYEQVGNTGYLQTTYYADGYEPNTTTLAGSASVTISGTSTITARLHYTDEDGNDQYVDLPDLTKTYQDNVDTLPDSDFPETLDSTDTDLIPDGYKLVANSRHIVNSTDDYGTATNGTAAFGETVTYYFNNDIVQYELVPEETATVTYIDDTTGKTLSTKTLQGGSGETNDYTTAATIAQYEAAGYTLVSDNTPDRFVFDNDESVDQAYEVHLKHSTTTSTQTSTRTITFTMTDGGDASKLPAPVTQTATYTISTDAITGVSTIVAIDGYPAYTAEQIAGYTASPTEVAAETPDITDPADIQSKSLVAAINYTQNTVDLTVTYVDDDNGGTTVGDPETLTGKTDETGTYSVTLPTGYALADGQSSSVAYTFTADDSDDLTIHLIHHLTDGTATTTRTITYVVAGDTSKTPAAVKQTAHYTTVTDDVTGASTATPTDGYDAVASPEIAGYTAEPTEVAAETLATQDTTALTNENVTVNYTAGDQILNITYYDTDLDQTVSTASVAGVTDQTITYDVTVPTNYELAAGASDVITYTLQAGGNAVTINLVHAHEAGTATTTRTITYVVAGGTTTAPEAVLQTAHYTTDTDLVTGASTATPTDGYDAVTTPTLAGYTPSESEVAAETLAAQDTTALTNEAVTVTYTANGQDLTVTYVDDDEGGKTVSTDSANGTTDQTITYDVTTPTNYELAPGQAATISYTLTAGTNATVVHLKHQIVNGTAETTRTITYVIATGDTSKTPKTVTQTVKYKTVSDKVTGTSYATAQNGYDAVTTPTLAGYTADQSEVAASYPGALATTDLTDSTATVTYNADPQTLTITYVDDDEGGKTVTTDTASGITDQTIVYNVTVPTNYELAADQSNTLSYKLGSADNTTVVHLKHQLVNGTATTTRTITYVVTDGDTSKAPDPVTQTVNYKTITDKVAGTSYATAQNGYDAVTTPTLAGYTADQSVVAASYPGALATADLTDTTAQVTYTADTQTATVTYIDGTTGETLATDDLSGKSDTATDYDPAATIAAYEAKGYVLATNDFPAAGLTFDADDAATQAFTITLTHGYHEDTPTSDPDNLTLTKTVTETIHYNYANGKQALPDKVLTINFQRTATVDDVTGAIVYTDWATTDATSFAATASPAISGYTADPATVAAVTGVTADTADITTNVVYTADPAKETGTGSDNGGTALPQTGGTTATTTGTGTGKLATNTGTKQAALPQTGDDKDSAAALLGGAAMIGILGLAAGDKKRKREN